jgi:hypothetical protein
VHRFWVVSHCSLVIASYPPCPFSHCAPCHHYRHSTCNPPHKQLLVGLEAGGALSSVIHHLFIILCCSFVIVHHLSYIICLLFVCCHLLSFVHCLVLFVGSSSVVCHLSIGIDWHPSSLLICPVSSGSQQ